RHGVPGLRDNAKPAPVGTSVTGRDPFQRFLVVREGGVEPPRPCGHWNLNPARLPIPPPAHWVCPRALPRRGAAPSDTRTLARWPGWIHIPLDRKSTRLNSSHVKISYAVFCL